MRAHLLAIGIGFACLFQGCSSSTNAPNIPTDDVPPVRTDRGVTTDFELRTDLRRLWEENASWTHVYLLSSIRGLSGTDVVKMRLAANATATGGALRPFYGDEVAARITTLLEQHVAGLANVVAAEKIGDASLRSAASADWYANADALAALLAQTNPSWSLGEMTAMLHLQLDKTMADANAILAGAAGVTACDALEAHVVLFADKLGDGIATQLPMKVSVDAMSSSERRLRLAMRQLWTQHVAWTHVYLVAALSNLPDAQASLDRLIQNQVDLGTALQVYYGSASDPIDGELHAHVSGLVQLVFALKSGDASLVESAKASWYANADRIALLLSGVNANWAEADLKSHMRTHLGLAIAESSALLAGDRATAVKSVDGAMVHVAMFSDVLAAGIAKQFPERQPL